MQQKKQLTFHMSGYFSYLKLWKGIHFCPVSFHLEIDFSEELEK